MGRRKREKSSEEAEKVRKRAKEFCTQQVCSIFQSVLLSIRCGNICECPPPLLLLVLHTGLRNQDKLLQFKINDIKLGTPTLECSDTPFISNPNKI